MKSSRRPNARTSRHSAITTSVWTALFLVLVTSCHDGPTSVSNTELSGSLHLTAGRSALVVEFSPAGSIDSLFIGPPAGSAGALVVSAPIVDRVLVYSPDTLPTWIRFRLFLSPGIARASVDGHVLQAADSTGRIDTGVGSQLLFDR